MYATTEFLQQKACILNLDPYNEQKRWGQSKQNGRGELQQQVYKAAQFSHYTVP